MRKAYEWVKGWIKDKITRRRVERLSNEIIVWITNNQQANMNDFTDMMGGYGYYITGFSLAGDEVVFANNTGCQINIKLGVETDEENAAEQMV